MNESNYIFIILWTIVSGIAIEYAFTSIQSNLVTSGYMLFQNPIIDLTAFITGTFLINTINYLVCGLWFESLNRQSNPSYNSYRRADQITKEITRGIRTLVGISIFTGIWYRYIDTWTPHYNYYGPISDLSYGSIICQILMYIVLADTWFYWSHRALHYNELYRSIHSVHHGFSDPSAFAQIAVHWVEALIHGPCVILVPYLLYPIHSQILITMGYMTGIYALGAHDGLMLDWNDHKKHHQYKMIKKEKNYIAGVNYGLYTHFWDKVCGTEFSAECTVPYDQTAKDSINILNH